jgi:hypothetical protein
MFLLNLNSYRVKFWGNSSILGLMILSGFDRLATIDKNLILLHKMTS